MTNDRRYDSLDANLTPNERSHDHLKVMDEVRRFTYYPHVGLTIDKRYVEHHDLFQRETWKTYLAQHDQFYKVFATIFYTINTKPSEDDFENFVITFELASTRHVVQLPLHAIVEWWRAGWPRQGKDVRQFTDLPWKVLRPLYELLQETLTWETGKTHLYHPQGILSTHLMSYYESVVYPQLILLDSMNDAHLPLLRTWVDELLTKAHQDLAEAYRHPTQSGWIYTGTTIQFESIDFKGDTPDNNPLLALAITYKDAMLKRWSLAKK